MFKIFDNFIALLGLAVIFLCISFLAGKDFESVANTDEEVVITAMVVENNKTEEKEEEIEEVIPETVNGILFGFDKSKGLTDVIMVGHVDPENNAVNVISVPRDLNIDFRKKEFKDIKANNPKNRVLYCKLNEVYSLTGRNEKSLDDVRKIVEIITGLDIKYVMKIQIDGFKDIVDSVGGVKFNVPRDMYYPDPYQDLYIDLKKGEQILDGNAAEGLVRYRKGYKGGDKDRIKVQQAFMKALVKQVLAERDVQKIKNLISTAYSHVETNFGLVTVLEYADFFLKTDYNKILSSDNMITIPSGGEKIDGRWFEQFSIKKAHKVVDELLKKNLETDSNSEKEQDKENNN